MHQIEKYIVRFDLFGIGRQYLGRYVCRCKVVVAVIPPLELVWLRYAVALLSLLILSLFTRQSWKVHKRDLLLIAAIGLIGNTVSIVTQEIGTKLSTAQMGAIITASTPAFMVVFARLMLKERLTLKKEYRQGWRRSEYCSLWGTEISICRASSAVSRFWLRR